MDRLARLRVSSRMQRANHSPKRCAVQAYSWRPGCGRRATILDGGQYESISVAPWWVCLLLPKLTFNHLSRLLPVLVGTSFHASVLLPKFVGSYSNPFLQRLRFQSPPGTGRSTARRAPGTGHALRPEHRRLSTPKNRLTNPGYPTHRGFMETRINGKRKAISRTSQPDGRHTHCAAQRQAGAFDSRSRGNTAGLDRVVV
jgi:hypothetical protein